MSYPGMITGGPSGRTSSRGQLYDYAYLREHEGDARRRDATRRPRGIEDHRKAVACENAKGGHFGYSGKYKGRRPPLMRTARRARLPSRILFSRPTNLPIARVLVSRDYPTRAARHPPRRFHFRSIRESRDSRTAEATTTTTLTTTSTSTTGNSDR